MSDLKAPLPIQTVNAIDQASLHIMAEAHTLRVHEDFMRLYYQSLVSINPTTNH